MKNLVVLYLLFLISCFSSFSQNKEVEIIYAGSLEIDKKNYPGYKILKKSNTKQVHLLHNGLEIWSDKVFFQQIENNLNSYGNVVLKQGDSLILTCDNLDYDGNTKIAVARKNVILDDKKMILKTQKLYYNRNLEIVEYPEKGTLFDSVTTIQSDKGIYYTTQNKYRFESNVNVKRNDLNIKSSKMDFYTSSNKSFF
ncbi:MAG: OstA-like protein, partial [Bacteroidota bacterium]|nr:OstA-like protein [Bacteroidota bacterium]